MNGYKPTNNYIKAQSDYDIGKNKREEFLNKVMTLYTGLKGYGQIAKNTNLAKFGHTVAEHYKNKKGTPEWAKEEYANPNKIFQDIAGTKNRTGYGSPDDGLFGMIRNMYSPSEEFNTMRDLGQLAQEQGRSTLVLNEGMSEEALAEASKGEFATAMANPYIQMLSALLGLGMGAGKQGSTLNRLNKDLGL